MCHGPDIYLHRKPTTTDIKLNFAQFCPILPNWSNWQADEGGNEIVTSLPGADDDEAQMTWSHYNGRPLMGGVPPNMDLDQRLMSSTWIVPDLRLFRDQQNAVSISSMPNFKR